MADSNEVGFSSEVLHLHAKDHVTPDLLITNGTGFIIIEESKGWFDASLFLEMASAQMNGNRPVCEWTS